MRWNTPSPEKAAHHKQTSTTQCTWCTNTINATTAANSCWGQKQMKVSVRLGKATASLLNLINTCWYWHKPLVFNKLEGGKQSKVFKKDRCGGAVHRLWHNEGGANKRRWQKSERHYQAAQRISGRQLCVEGPALGVQPQPTGPPWQPDVLQNKYCCRIQSGLRLASGISFSTTRLLGYAGLNLEPAVWVSGPRTRHVPLLHLQ